MMTNTKVNGGAAFWQDLSKKGGVWSAVAGLSVPVSEGLETLLGGLEVHEKALIVTAIFAVARAVLGLVQGKTGNPETAKFDKE